MTLDATVKSGNIKRGLFSRRKFDMKRAVGYLFVFLAAMTWAGCGSGGPSNVGPPKGAGPPADSWNITLKVSVPEPEADGGSAYNRLVAGQAPSASNEFDNGFDVRALLAGPVIAYFPHAGDMGYGLGSTDLWQDIRTDEIPAEWRVEVIAESGRVVTIRWTQPEGDISCESHDFTLEDTDGDIERTDLCESESLTYVGDGLPRHFILRVS